MNQQELWENKWKELADANQVQPPPSVWTNIERSLASESKTKIPIWWISSLSIVVLGVATYIFAASNFSNSSSIKAVEFNNRVAFQNSNTSIESFSSQEKQTNVVDDDSSPRNANETHETIVHSRVDRNETNTIHFASHRVREGKVQSIAQNSKYDAPEEQLNHNKEMEQSKGIVDIKNDIFEGKSLPYVERKSMGEVASEENFSEQKKSLGSLEIAIPSLPVLLSKIALTQNEITIPNTPTVLTGGDCPDFHSKDQIQFFAAAEGAAGFPMVEMKVKVDDVALLANRRHTETPLVVWSGSLYGGIKWRKHFSLSTGFQWNQVVEKFSYQRPGLIIITIRPGIDTTVEKRNYFRQAAIRYTTFDIPLLLSYDWGRKKWEYNIEGGPIFNVVLKAKGLMLLDENDIRELIPSNDYYRNQLGLGWQAGFSVHRNLKNNFSLYCKPFYRSYFKDWSATQNPIHFSIQNVQCALGVRKMF